MSKIIKAKHILVDAENSEQIIKEIRERHRPNKEAHQRKTNNMRPSGFIIIPALSECRFCHEPWPCDAAYLIAVAQPSPADRGKEKG